MQFYLLPFPPSINRLYRYTNKGVYKTAAWNAWRDNAIYFISQQKSERAPTIEHKVAVEMAAGRPDKRKRDLDNLTKATFDFLQTDIPGGRIIKDDSLIERYEVYWASGVVGIQVMIKELDGLQAEAFVDL